MNIEIYEHLDKKGLGTKDMFDAIFVGKKGTTREITLTDGKLELDFNSNIGDAEMKVAITLLSHTFNQMGIDTVNALKDGKQLLNMDEQTGQAVYTLGVSVNAKEISELVHNGDRKKDKRVFKCLQHLENLTIRYSVPGVMGTMRLFNNVAHKNGVITFNVANMLLNRLGPTLQAFRLAPILEHNGIAMRLSVYVETHQRPGKNYTDSSGEKRRKYYPMNEYRLDVLAKALHLDGQQESKIIINIQKAFNDLNTGEKNPIPKYKYNKRRRSFESEYKNGNNILLEAEIVKK